MIKRFHVFVVLDVVVVVVVVIVFFLSFFLSFFLFNYLFKKELKFKFANDLEAKRFSEILGKSCAEPILSLVFFLCIYLFFLNIHSFSKDHLKLSQSSVHDVINFNYVTVATVDFKDYGQTCLDLRKGERVVIGERKGTWVAGI